jgi:hypothetical protein
MSACCHCVAQPIWLLVVTNRNGFPMPILKTLVHNYGVRVIGVSEGVYSNMPGWETVASFICLHHEQFIRDLAANVFKGQEGTVLSNFSVGDYRIGYDSVPSPNGEMVGRGRNAKPRMVYRVHSEQADIVRQVFHWFVQEKRWIFESIRRRLERQRDLLTELEELPPAQRARRLAQLQGR